MPKTFQNLKLPGVGEKMYKFTQAKSVPYLNPKRVVNQDVINTIILSTEEFQMTEAGICSALVTAWLAEKMGKGSSFTGASAGEAVHLKKNFATVEAAVPEYLHAVNESGAYKLLERAGLDDRLPDDTGFRYIRNPKEKPTVDVVSTLAATANKKLLPQGTGCYITAIMKRNAPPSGGTHAIGMYRSHGNTLYFFDPNCGVYKVLDPVRFFGEWISAYMGSGCTVTMDKDRSSTFVRKK